MKKAILMVYIPEEYSEQLDRLSVDYTLFYHDENGTVKPVDVESRCRLKPLPQYINSKDEYNLKFGNSSINGWNSCVDEILG